MIPGTKKIYYLDIKGQPQILKDCAVNNFEHLQILYSLFWETVLELDPTANTVSFYDLIITNPDIKEISLSILEILGVKKETLGIETLAAMIHSYNDDEGVYHKGLVWERYFEQTEKKQNESSNTVSWEEHRSSLLAILSLTEGGLENAQKILNTLSNEEVLQYLEQRAKILKAGQEEKPEDKRSRLKEMYRKRFGSLNTLTNQEIEETDKLVRSN